MIKNKAQTAARLLLSSILVIFMNSVIAAEAKLKVNITPELATVNVKHRDKTVTIKRKQNPDNRIVDALSLTSRACPPHCLQPIKFKGVETIGELELINYLEKISNGDSSILVIDTRSSKMAAEATIPGSINIHGDKLIENRGANPIEIEDILTQQFGVRDNMGTWNFKQAKTLVLYCYGIWCGQATRTLDALVSIGYPKYKLKWYRGGLQAWESVGLTTIRNSQ